MSLTAEVAEAAWSSTGLDPVVRAPLPPADPPSEWEEIACFYGLEWRRWRAERSHHRHQLNPQ